MPDGTIDEHKESLNVLVSDVMTFIRLKYHIPEVKQQLSLNGDVIGEGDVVGGYGLVEGDVADLTIVSDGKGDGKGTLQQLEAVAVEVPATVTAEVLIDGLTRAEAIRRGSAYWIARNQNGQHDELTAEIRRMVPLIYAQVAVPAFTRWWLHHVPTT